MIIAVQLTVLSSRRNLVIRDVAQPGSAPALGAGCRRFKSSRPDHFLFLKKNSIMKKLSNDPFNGTITWLEGHPDRYQGTDVRPR